MNASTMLADLLEKGKLSAGKLAELLDTSLVSVARWQRGAGEPNSSQVQRLIDLHGTVLKGHPPAAREHNPFSSRGVRRRRGIEGQGVLGEPLAVITLADLPQAPIISRL